MKLIHHITEYMQWWLVTNTGRLLKHLCKLGPEKLLKVKRVCVCVCGSWKMLFYVNWVLKNYQRAVIRVCVSVWVLKNVHLVFLITQSKFNQFEWFLVYRFLISRNWFWTCTPCLKNVITIPREMQILFVSLKLHYYLQKSECLFNRQLFCHMKS